MNLKKQTEKKLPVKTTKFLLFDNLLILVERCFFYSKRDYSLYTVAIITVPRTTVYSTLIEYILDKITNTFYTVQWGGGYPKGSRHWHRDIEIQSRNVHILSVTHLSPYYAGGAKCILHSF